MRIIKTGYSGRSMVGMVVVDVNVFLLVLIVLRTSDASLTTDDIEFSSTDTDVSSTTEDTSTTAASPTDSSLTTTDDATSHHHHHHQKANLSFVTAEAAAARADDDELYDSVPLFGLHDSPIELGLRAKRKLDQDMFHYYKFSNSTSSSSTAMSMGSAGGGSSSSSSSGVIHLQLDPALDLEKRQRQKKIRYLLRSKSGEWEELRRNGSDADSDGRWYPQGKLKVIVHGYSPPVFATGEQSIHKMHMFEIGNAYGNSGLNYNVIIVDWTSLSTQPLYKYYEAAISTFYAGEDVAGFLRNLKSLRLISSWEDIHMIGFSLGAHVAGIAGAAILRLCGDGSKLGRITGIDPAGPLFEEGTRFYGSLTRPLNSTDASFVDVIHCNMGDVLTFGFARGRFGTTVKSGDADFYPNGGESQKNCTELQDRLEACSHIKCPLLFAQSITEYFLSCPCQIFWEGFKGGKCPCWRDDGSETALGELYSKRAFGKHFRFV